MAAIAYSSVELMPMKCLANSRYSAIILALCWFFLASCEKRAIVSNEPAVDVLLIGGGIMSATLGSMLADLNPELKIHVYERLNELALESSGAWNNAGTGHASYSELNYTPEVGGIIDIKKALDVNAGFEISKEYWAYLVRNKKIPDAKSFINDVPHMSFVWGEKGVEYLKKRYDAITKHPFFKGMEYSEDKARIKQWMPLIMEGRDPAQKVAATRMVGGTDVDFGSLTRNLFANMKSNPNSQIHTEHEVTDIKRNQDKTWRVWIRDHKGQNTKAINAKFVFIGAGGAAILLLQKTDIEEAQGFGGFPVGGAWLVTDKQELIDKHWAKVYGQAGVGAPPMSVPHLDTLH